MYEDWTHAKVWPRNLWRMYPVYTRLSASSLDSQVQTRAHSSYKHIQLDWKATSVLEQMLILCCQ